MKPSWVFAVWESMGGSSSPDDSINATDLKFLSHVCPVFNGQSICLSSLPKKDKLALKSLVEEHGEDLLPYKNLHPVIDNVDRVSCVNLCTTLI